MLVEGIHFRLDWTSAADLGWKALAVNLSDLAAMGARPGRALVSVAVDATRRGLVVESRAAQSLADRTGTQVVGGDTVRSPGPLVINVALVGEADHARLLRRDAARVGDLVGVTGTLGAASAGLALLTERDRTPRLPSIRSWRRCTGRSRAWRPARSWRGWAFAARSTSATGCERDAPPGPCQRRGRRDRR